MGMIPNIGNGKYRDVTVEGDAVQHRAIDDCENHHIIVFSTGDGPNLEFRFYNWGEVEADYNGIGANCLNGDHLCAIVDASLAHEGLSEEEYWEKKERLNCGCWDAESDEYEEVGREILQEAGIKSITA